MFRQFSNTIDQNGNGTVEIRQTNAAKEWDIYQISVVCGAASSNCAVLITVNGAFLCSTPQGSGDTATGPPDLVLSSSDVLEVQWIEGIPRDSIVVNIWFNENIAGTTFSSAH